MTTYNFKQIEQNWREKWFNDNIYEAVDFSKKPKKYILAELPYPSGKFLHIGHMMRYTIPEIYSRYLRMQGYNVLFPMGWDSFGLPAETFAIKEGITPQEAISRAAKDYKLAMQNMGYAIDWNREINTSDPDYYKWTQWMFIRLWEKGLAKIKEMPVWWCKELGVLADEEVLPDENSPTGKKSERGSYPVYRKQFKQWVLDIPAYADRLLEDLDQVDYMESVKFGQKNWIGKKEGAHIDFEINGESARVFTTRPDTIFGVTFLALSPQHHIVEKLLPKVSNREEVKAYIENAKNLTDLEKQTKEKTGVLLLGVSAKHPFDEVTEQIPVYLADYIIADYGTGAIMGVPGHDDRDREFAQKYNIKVIKVIEEQDGKETVINSGKYNGMTAEEFKQEVIKRLEQEKKGEQASTYKIREQVFSRQRYWGEPIPLIYKQNGEIEALSDEQLPLTLPVMKDFLAGEDGVSPLSKNEEWINTTDSEGNPAKRESDTMPTWAGSNWYYIRYIDPKNKEKFADMEKLKYWMPVDKYFGDAGHTTAHLIYSRFWYKFLYDQGYVPRSEPYNFRMSGGLLLGPDNHKMSKSRGNVVNPADVVNNYGADAARLYLSFIGPYEDTYPWNENGIKSTWRLLKTIYELREKVVPNNNINESERAFHKMLKNITAMFENLKMNTAVSEIMIFVNHLKTVDKIDQEIWKNLIKVIAPLTPFLAEELWQEINSYTEWKKENSVHLQDWPKFDEKLATEDIKVIPVQINGKVRSEVSVETGDSEETVKKKIMELPKVQEHTNGKEIVKFIYITNKIANLVVK